MYIGDIAMGLKGEGLGALGDKKKKPRPQNFTIFIFETFHFSIQPTPIPSLGVKISYIDPPLII